MKNANENTESMRDKFLAAAEEVTAIATVAFCYCCIKL